MNKLFKTIILSCIAIAVISLLACKNNKADNTQQKEEHIKETAHQYACSMHPEVTGNKGDKCHICGMELAPMTENRSSNISVNITPSQSPVKAGQPVTLSVNISNNGQPVALELVHEKKIHLITVDESLNWFNHTHPEQQADGHYKLTTTFPAAGKYYLFSDFKVSDANATINRQELMVTGNVVTNRVKDAEKLISAIDGYNLTLVKSGEFKTNKPQTLAIQIEKDGKALTGKELQPYLGAPAHVMVISRADIEFLHIHAASNDKYPVYTKTHFTKPGWYRLWVQFQTNGKVHTADFTINVLQSEVAKSNDGNSHGLH